MIVMINRRAPVVESWREEEEEEGGDGEVRKEGEEGRGGGESGPD